MEPDLQLDAYVALYEGPQREAADVTALLADRHPASSQAQIHEAMEIARRARSAEFSAPSTYACATAGEAGEMFSQYLLSQVPEVSNRLHHKLVSGNMRAWLY